jgi:hypothetical protein
MDYYKNNYSFEAVEKILLAMQTVIVDTMYTVCPDRRMQMGRKYPHIEPSIPLLHHAIIPAGISITLHLSGRHPKPVHSALLMVFSGRAALSRFVASFLLKKMTC